MTKNNTEEEKAECPICGAVRLKRGMFMHIWQTDDPPGEGHYPRESVPDGLDIEDVKVSGNENVQMDYPDTQNLEDAEYLDTYTGKAYKGKRGLMVHLGQLAGENNIPINVTRKFDAEDFPIVETDDDGNITNVIKWGSDDIPPLEPYLPWYDDSDLGYIRKKKIKKILEKYRDSENGIDTETLEKELLS